MLSGASAYDLRESGGVSVEENNFFFAAFSDTRLCRMLRGASASAAFLWHAEEHADASLSNLRGACACSAACSQEARPLPHAPRLIARDAPLLHAQRCVCLCRMLRGASACSAACSEARPLPHAPRLIARDALLLPLAPRLIARGSSSCGRVM